MGYQDINSLVRDMLNNSTKRNLCVDVLENGKSSTQRAQDLVDLVAPWGYQLAYTSAKDAVDVWDDGKQNVQDFVSDWRNNPPSLSPIVDKTMIFS